MRKYPLCLLLFAAVLTGCGKSEVHATAAVVTNNETGLNLSGTFSGNGAGVTNVNFVTFTGPRTLAIRTYERGVEDETLACGTGSVAAALVGACLGKLDSPVAVHTRGGEILNVYFKPQAGACSDVYLEGDALVVYQGELWVEELK